MPARSLTDELLARLALVPHATIGTSMFSDRPAVWVDGKELAHLHAEKGAVAIDLRLGRKTIRAMREELADLLGDHVRSSSSDWIELRVAEPKHVERVVALFQTIAAAHAPKGRDARPPPTDAELAQRRKLHGPAAPPQKRRSKPSTKLGTRSGLKR